MPTFSKTPWRFERNDFFDEVFDANGQTIARAEGEKKDDARLIAAAPELYECVRDVVQSGLTEYMTRGMLERFKRVLSKAGWNEYEFQKAVEAIAKAQGKNND
jgi:hypothetical protein